MPNGGKRPGSGRKPGARNKLCVAMAREVKLRGITPAEFLDGIMHDSDDVGMQVEAAKALMTYVHQKQPELRDTTIRVPDAITVKFVGL